MNRIHPSNLPDMFSCENGQQCSLGMDLECGAYTLESVRRIKCHIPSVDCKENEEDRVWMCFFTDTLALDIAPDYMENCCGGELAVEVCVRPSTYSPSEDYGGEIPFILTHEFELPPGSSITYSRTQTQRRTTLPGSSETYSRTETQRKVTLNGSLLLTIFEREQVDNRHHTDDIIDYESYKTDPEQWGLWHELRLGNIARVHWTA